MRLTKKRIVWKCTFCASEFRTFGETSFGTQGLANHLWQEHREKFIK